jgi:hypothetical protein
MAKLFELDLIVFRDRFVKSGVFFAHLQIKRFP